jgi:hypothetical protein
MWNSCRSKIYARQRESAHRQPIARETEIGNSQQAREQTSSPCPCSLPAMFTHSSVSAGQAGRGTAWHGRHMSPSWLLCRSRVWGGQSAPKLFGLGDIGLASDSWLGGSARLPPFPSGRTRFVQSRRTPTLPTLSAIASRIRAPAHAGSAVKMSGHPKQRAATNSSRADTQPSAA